MRKCALWPIGFYHSRLMSIRWIKHPSELALTVFRRFIIFMLSVSDSPSLFSCQLFSQAPTFSSLFFFPPKPLSFPKASCFRSHPLALGSSKSEEGAAMRARCQGQWRSLQRGQPSLDWPSKFQLPIQIDYGLSSKSHFSSWISFFFFLNDSTAVLEYLLKCHLFCGCCCNSLIEQRFIFQISLLALYYWTICVSLEKWSCDNVKFWSWNPKLEP